MWVILHKLCRSWPKGKRNTGLFRVFKSCSRFMEQTFESACCSTPEARVDLKIEADATLKSLLIAV